MPLEYKVDILKKLGEAGYSTYRIRKEKIMGEATLQQIRKGEFVSFDNLELLCSLLDCQPGDLIGMKENLLRLTQEEASTLFGAIDKLRLVNCAIIQERPIRIIRQRSNREKPACIFTFKSKADLRYYRMMMQMLPEDESILFDIPIDATEEEVRQSIEELQAWMDTD